MMFGSVANARGGVHDLRMDRGFPARFPQRYPLLITETCCHTHFYDEVSRKSTHSWLVFANFWITHPCLRKIIRKRDPCLENFGPKNPPMWAVHIRTLNLLYTPLELTGKMLKLKLSEETNFLGRSSFYLGVASLLGGGV